MRTASGLGYTYLDRAPGAVRSSEGVEGASPPISTPLGSAGAESGFGETDPPIRHGRVGGQARVEGRPLGAWIPGPELPAARVALY